MSRLLKLTCSALFFIQFLLAQFGSGIQGTVLDTTSAVIPDVKVTITNADTGVSRTVMSSEVGVYRAPNLGPGTYKVLASKDGFVTSERDSVVLAVSETRRVDFTLGVGSLIENVNVTAQPTVLETEEGRISGQINSKQLRDLPIPNRNVYNLLSLQPGVTGRSLGNDLVGGASRPSVYANGMRNDANSSTIDDTNANSISSGGRFEISPNVETVGEVRVVTNNFSAEEGRNMGAQVRVITKSGTNEFHGTAWDFHRNNKFESRNFFLAGVPVYRRNQFGFGLGGPIVRNRTFFHTTLEMLRESGSSAGTATVETPQLRDYVLQTRPNSIAAHVFGKFRPVAYPTINIRDLGSPRPGVNQFTSTPDGIPDTGTVQYSANSDTRSRQLTARVDHELRPGKDRLYVYYLRHGGRSITDPVRPDFLQFTENYGTFGNVNYTHIFSPTTLNEFRAGVTRYIGRYCVPTDATNPLGERDCFDLLNKQVPETIVTGMSQIRGAFFPGGWSPTEIQAKNTFSTIRGTHALRMGGEIRRAINILWHTRNLIPSYTFASVLDYIDDEPIQMVRTVDPRTGEPNTTRTDQLIWEGAMFVQDDWKVRRNLTINIGLRYDYFGAYTDRHNRLRNFIPGPGSVFSQSVATGKADISPRSWEPDTLNLAPRFGFAWDIGGRSKNVVRGGYGITYDRMPTVYAAGYRENPPLSAAATLGLFFGTPFTYSLGDSSKPNYGYPLDPGLKLGLDERNGIKGSRVSLVAVNPSFQQPYGQNWFLSVQRSLPKQLVVELSYMGSMATHLVNVSNVNRYSGDLLDSRFDGFNPSFSAINMAQTSSTSAYHGGTLTVRRQFGQGFSFQANYTYSKVVTDAENGEGVTSYYDAHNRRRDRSVASFDVPQRVAFNGLWEIPFLRTCTSWACKVAGGWQLSGYGILEKGLPLNVTTSAAYPRGDFNADGTNADRPNAPADSVRRQGFSKQEFLTGIFQVADFPLPASGTFGNLGRNTFRSPGFARVDLSLMKSVAFSERIHADLRLEAFNTFNRVNLNAPAANLTSNDFGKSTSAGDPRVYQVSLKLRF